MSNELNLNLTEITAPSLTDANYGSNINSKFSAINSNFKIISNRALVKGDRGISVRIKQYPLINGSLDEDNDSDESNSAPAYTTWKFTSMGLMFLDAILLEYAGKTLSDLKISSDGTIVSLQTSISNKVPSLKSIKGSDNVTHGFLDYLLTDSALNLQYNIVEEYDPVLNTTQNKVKTSLNKILFKDYRFIHTPTTTTESEATNWSALTDTSCTVVCQYIDSESNTAARCEVIQEMPCLYFDPTSKVFCWKINGEKTGMIASGPMGANGLDSYTHILCVDKDHQSPTGPYYATKYFMGDGTGGWSENITAKNIEDYHISKGDNCIVMRLPTTTEINGVDADEQDAFAAKPVSIYYSRVHSIEDDGTAGNKKIGVYCNESAAIPNAFNAQALELLQTSSIQKTGVLPGLHVPLSESGSSTNNSYRHMLWSQKELQGSSNTTDCNVLHLSPIRYDSSNSQSENNASKWFQSPSYYDNPLFSVDYPNTTFGSRKVDGTEYKLICGSMASLSQSDYSTQPPLGIAVGSLTSKTTGNSTSMGIARLGSLWLNCGVDTNNGEKCGDVHASILKIHSALNVSKLLNFNGKPILSESGDKNIFNTNYTDFLTQLGATQVLSNGGLTMVGANNSIMFKYENKEDIYGQLIVKSDNNFHISAGNNKKIVINSPVDAGNITCNNIKCNSIMFKPYFVSGTVNSTTNTIEISLPTHGENKYEVYLNITESITTNNTISIIIKLGNNYKNTDEVVLIHTNINLGITYQSTNNDSQSPSYPDSTTLNLYKDSVSEGNKLGSTTSISGHGASSARINTSLDFVL